MLKIVKNTIFVLTIELGAIYCRRAKMKAGVKTLKKAVTYDLMNKTCCMVDWYDPRGGAFALHFRPYPLAGGWAARSWECEKFLSTPTSDGRGSTPAYVT